MVENNNLSANLISDVEQQVAALYEEFERYKQHQDILVNEKLAVLEQQAHAEVDAYKKSEHEKIEMELEVFNQNQQRMSEEQIGLLRQEIKDKEKLLVDSIIKEVFSRYGS